MDQVTKVKKYLKREQWKTLIKDCQSSGMTVKDWCAANDICEQTYYRNLKKIREELCSSLPAAVYASKPDVPVAFKKLEVSPPIQSTKASVMLHLPNAVLEIKEGASQQTVQAVLLALQSLC